MRIVIIANSSSGLFGFRQELIQKLAYENDVIAFTPDSGRLAEIEAVGCRVITTPLDRRGMNPIKDFSIIRLYKKLLREERPDLVITYTIKPNIYGGLAAKRLGIPYACNITGLGTAFQKEGWLKKLIVILYKVALRGVKVVFFENADNRDTFVNEGIVPMAKTCLLMGAGVNLQRYQVSEYPEGDKIRFLFMGRVMAEKGIDELFDAMKRLVDDGINCELDVLGGYEEDYKEKISKYEKEGWLHYYGYQKDVRPFIEKCHCFVLPSWHEGMSNTNLENAASGRPVITSNIPGCMEAVIDGTTGYLAERKNADDLYKVMRKFVELPYAQRKAMVLAGRKHMEEVFDKKKVVEDTIRHL